MNIVKRTRKQNGHDELARTESEFWPAFSRERNRTLNRTRRFFEEPWTLGSALAPWPAIDLSEDDKALTLRVDVPGMNPKNVNVDVSGNLLTIRGSREEEKQSDKGGILRHERHEGSFLRTVTLPSYVDTAKIDARYEKGVLTITAAKVPGAGPRRVHVKSE